MRLTILLDNQPSENKALVVEHGLAIWIETQSCRFLFDCSASDAAMKNARRLGIDLTSADFVVCSHSHYDHAAGYRDLVESDAAPATLYTGPDFFSKKYAFNGVCYTDLSCGFTADFLSAHSINHRAVNAVYSPAPGCWLIGGFSRTHAFETSSNRFVKGEIPTATVDDFSDEICLAIETEHGLAVVLGCAHPGVLNMLNQVCDVMQKPVYAVFGGSHLVEADETRIAETIAQMKAMGVQLIGFNHCSGQRISEYLRMDSTLQSCPMSVGNCVVL